MTLADAQDAYGASWGEDDMIVYSRPDGGGLMEIPAAGGTPRPLTTIDTSEAAHRFPVHLPDDWGVLFNTGALLDLTTTSIMVKPREGEPKLLIEDGTNARYAPTGHLLYGQRGALVAVPLDLERLEIVGDPTPALEGVQQSQARSATQFSLSEDGTLAYVPGIYTENDRTLAWVDRVGSEEILPVPSRPYGQPRLAPSGTQIAIGIGDDDTDVWIYDVEDEALRRLTFGGRAMGFRCGRRMGAMSFSSPAATACQRCIGNRPTAVAPPSGSPLPRRLTCHTRSHRMETNSPWFKRDR